MVRVVAELVARARLALVVGLATLASLVAAASIAPAMTTQAVVLLTALSAAGALAGVHCLTAPDSVLDSLRPRRRAATVPLVLAGRTTDVVHHPVQPRAPGLV